MKSRDGSHFLKEKSGSRPCFSILVALIFSGLAQAAEPQDQPFAVVELFTSEGCSSCPSADLLASRLSAWARTNHKPVYPLVFHVDYWNNLGWRDIFSSPEFTLRQKMYARIFKDQGVYTPQMIVNGSDAFVGSDQRKLQQDLDRELLIPAGVVLEAGLRRQKDRLSVKYKSEGFKNGDVIHVALVERGLSTDVTAGENGGRRLYHDNVVRQFETRPLTEDGGEVSVSLNKISDHAQASVIVYVQNPKTMLIEAAKQLDLGHG